MDFFWTSSDEFLDDRSIPNGHRNRTDKHGKMRQKTAKNGKDELSSEKPAFFRVCPSGSPLLPSTWRSLSLLLCLDLHQLSIAVQNGVRIAVADRNTNRGSNDLAHLGEELRFCACGHDRRPPFCVEQMATDSDLRSLAALPGSFGIDQATPLLLGQQCW